MRSFDYWRNLANCVVTWRVEDDQAERSVLLDKVAAKCGELELRGEKASVWHAVSLVTGNRCHCFDCSDRG